MQHTNEATGKPIRQRHRSTNEYAGASIRMAKALGARVASGEVDQITQFARVEEALRLAKWEAIDGLHRFGYSWAEIAAETGQTRQSVQKWHRENRPAS